MGVPATAVQFAAAPRVGDDWRVNPVANADQETVRVPGEPTVAPKVGGVVIGFTRTSWMALIAGE